MKIKQSIIEIHCAFDIIWINAIQYENSMHYPELQNK